MRISSKIKSYDVEIVDDVLRHAAPLFARVSHDRRFFMVDEHIARMYQQQVYHCVGRDVLLTIRATEERKEYHALEQYYRALMDAGMKRNDMLVTIGGGILQDISGFIASTLYRGVPWMFFPTTLLAQADSCIGSKTSINFGTSKNLIGSFYPPDVVAVDVGFCATLAPADFASGIGEIIKYHCMVNDETFERLERYLACGDVRAREHLEPIMRSSLAVKCSYIADDEFDRGRRNLLNYGHSFAHALEAGSAFAIAHGEAVIIGMGLANLLSLRRGMLVQQAYDRIERVLEAWYPVFDYGCVPTATLVEYLKRDKKRVGKDLTLILCRGIGKQEKCTDVTPEEVAETYAVFARQRAAAVR